MVDYQELAKALGPSIAIVFLGLALLKLLDHTAEVTADMRTSLQQVLIDNYPSNAVLERLKDLPAVIDRINKRLENLEDQRDRSKLESYPQRQLGQLWMGTLPTALLQRNHKCPKATHLGTRLLSQSRSSAGTPCFWFQQSNP